MALAKNALIEFDGKVGRLYINGDEFPFDVVAFELRTLDTDTQLQTLQVTIPLEQGAMVLYEHDLPPLRKVEGAEPAPVDSALLFPPPAGELGAVMKVHSATAEPDRNRVFKVSVEDYQSSTPYLRYMPENAADAAGWYFGEENGYDAGRGPWVWADLAQEFPGRYEIVGAA